MLVSSLKRKVMYVNSFSHGQALAELHLFARLLEIVHNICSPLKPNIMSSFFTEKSVHTKN